MGVQLFNVWLKRALSGVIALVFGMLIGCGGSGGGDGDNSPPPPPVANVAPIANAGLDQTVDEQVSVTLLGTGSDSDGAIASYSWVQTAGDGITLNNAASATASFTAPVTNRSLLFTFELTVTDDDGAIAKDSLVVTVVPVLEGTYVSGRVLDTNAFTTDGTELPIVGVRVHFIGETDVVITDDNGEFFLENLEAGDKVIDLDSKQATAAPSGDGYASFREHLLINEGANVITRPIYLPRIATSSLTPIDPAADTVVTNSELGISLTVFAGSAVDESGNLFTGELSISEVPLALAPATLPVDLEPGLLFTIQPVGVFFNTPATLSIRNDRDAWPAGSKINFWSLDPELGVFAVVGDGEVSSDGATIETVNGGVRAADWHAPLPPSVAKGDTPKDNDGECQGDDCCRKCIFRVGSEVEASNGRFREQIVLPTYLSQNKARRLEFGYSSDRAYPVEVMAAAPIVEASTPVPNQVSYQGVINGVDQGYDIFLDTSVLQQNQDQAFRIALALDATQLPTNSYVGQARISSHYDRSTVSGRILEDYMIVNDIQSEFGAGWRLLNNDRIYPATSGGVILVDGSGFPRRYKEPNGSGSLVTIVASFDARPEVDALQALLDEMGIAHQFRSTGTTINTIDTPISINDIQDTALFLATGTNGVGLFGFGGLDDNIKRNLLDVLESANDQGVPILFASADLGPFTAQLVEPDLVRYERLMGVRRNTDNDPRGGNATGLWSLNDPTHPIFNGSFGNLAPDPSASNANGLGPNSNYSPFLHQPANLGESVLVTEYDGAGGSLLNDHAIFTHQNAVSGVNALTITAVMPTPTTSLPDEVVVVLKNSIEWLMTNITEPGELVSPNGDYSVMTLEDDGTYTRRTKYGTLYTFDANGYLQTIADRNGNTTTYGYDANQLLTTITDPVGKVTQLTYTDGKLSSASDPAGRETGFEYDTSGNLIKVTYPDNSTRQFGYDENHLMTSQTDQRGFINTYQFNTAGQFTQSTQADGSVRSLTPAQSIGLVEEVSKNSKTNPAKLVRIKLKR